MLGEVMRSSVSACNAEHVLFESQPAALCMMKMCWDEGVDCPTWEEWDGEVKLAKLGV